MLREPWGTSAMRSAIDLPVVGGVAGHQVERHAHVLHRAAEHAQVAEALAGVVLLERELEPLAQHLGGDAVGVGRRSAVAVERAQRGAVVLGALVAPVGGVVGHLVVVAGDALAGRGERIERGEALDVAVGEVEHGRLEWSSLRSSSSGRPRSRGTVGPAGCHTRAAGSARRRPATTGSTTFDGVRARDADPVRRPCGR